MKHRVISGLSEFGERARGATDNTLPPGANPGLTGGIRPGQGRPTFPRSPAGRSIAPRREGGATVTGGRTPFFRPLFGRGGGGRAR